MTALHQQNLKKSSDCLSEKESFHRWLSGIPYEVAFWKSYYGNKKRRADLFSWSNYNKPCKLENFDINAFIRDFGGENPQILDVGCALSYVFGNIINGKTVTVIYIDPLAPFYNKILSRYKIDRPRIQFGMIESLSVSFEKNFAHFIHIQNALDHCHDPFKGILQCLAVLKCGGILYLNHFINEAENENYRGFHQFNIAESEGDLKIWNRNININVTERLKDFAHVETSITPEGRVIAVIKKFAELPSEDEDSAKLTRDISKRMMDVVEYFYSFRNTESFQLKRFISSVGHRTMRLLPYSLLIRIKRMAGR